MVTFRQRMDSQGKIYIVKPLRQAGFVDTIEMVPNAKAAVIYRAGTQLKEILASLKVITADLESRIKADENEQSAGAEPWRKRGEKTFLSNYVLCSTSIAQPTLLTNPASEPAVLCG